MREIQFWSSPVSSEFKLCGACKRLLPLGQFGYKNKATGRLQSKCKDCSREYAKQHYLANRDAYVEKAKLNNATYRNRNAELISRLLEEEACCGCGSQQGLGYYTGGVDEGQPVHMAVHGGLSEDAVLAAVARSAVVCKACLGQHFGRSIEFWQKLSAPERAALRAQRALEGYKTRPHSYFKAYRRTDGTVSGAPRGAAGK